MANRSKPVISSVGIHCNQPRIAKAAFLAGLMLLTAACASSFERPAPVDEDQLRERATTKTVDSIRVSATIPSEDESRSIFGVDLRQHEIQPFWLEIENGTDRQFNMLPTGLDPEYFDPLEVAYLYEDTLTDEGHAELAAHIIALSFDSRRIILPGETISGFVYLYQSHSSLMAEIDLLGRKWSTRISLLVPVLGVDEAQDRIRAHRELYTEDDVIEIDDDPTSRTALEGLPCCAADETGNHQKLPLNLVLIGEIEDVAPAFGRRLYRYNPASPLYVYGRAQDLSGQKISRWVAPQPHTVRLWLTPLRYQGKPIWIGQVSTRLGGRFGESAEEKNRIEPEVDEARNDLIQDLIYSQTVAKVGFVKGAECPITAENHEVSGGQVCHTDGLRAVMVFGSEEVSLARIDTFEWESLVDRYRQQTD